MAKIFDKVPILRKRDIDPKNVAILHTYYTRSTFRSHKIEPLYGFTEFLCNFFLLSWKCMINFQTLIFIYAFTANIGGLLGLFMGFSVISVIEMFYFISIRPYCNYLRFSNKRRELMSKLYRSLDKLRQRKQSPFIIKAVQSNSEFDYDYHRRYLD